MAKKEFSYRGKTLEELRSMGFKELLALLPSPARRSLMRGYTEEQKILLRNLEKNDGVKTHVRDLVILPNIVDKTLKIYQGKEFQTVVILPEMIGHRLGEFALTRKRAAHSSPGVDKGKKK